MKAEPENPKIERIPFKMHPRVFQALGSELVTSDVVAVIELVKNSYDAFATRVDVRFRTDQGGNTLLEIEDNGCGMTRATIDDVWCMVATPFREEHPRSHKGKKTRRTTGAKGLGRLSAARLGHGMRMVTRSQEDGAWQVDVDWSGLTTASTLDSCHALRRPYDGSDFKRSEGTLIRITGLKSAWRFPEIEELGEALSRVTSPFASTGDFAIYLTPPGASATPTKIETSEFLQRPPYAITGEFDAAGNLKYRYEFKPFHGKGRSQEMPVEWAIVQKDINETLPKEERLPLKPKPDCGPFRFQIRVWDLDKDSIAEAESKFQMRRSIIRRQIRAFKGISLYRDGVLVLPKSETNRDWLGLDLRRVSKVGTRLSTSQIVGYVSVSADENPAIDDTSDRERLARNEAVAEFERILKDIVYRLEEQRSRDQEEHEEPSKMRELFDDLSPKRILDEAQDLAAENATATDVMPLLTQFSRKAEHARQQIERQFFYYSRLATIGTISEMLVHEVGNNSGALDAFVLCVRNWLDGKEADRKYLEKRLSLAGQAVAALQRLAERFRPLAGRRFQRGKRTSSLRETLDACLKTLDEAIRQDKVSVDIALKGKDTLRIDPGELFPVVYNIIDNALYWLSHQKGGKRRILIESSNASGLVACTISDSGPGIYPEDREKIFHAGVTRRPNGSGMGLTVAGELVEGNGGKIFAEHPGKLAGATFRFLLPPA